MTHDDLLWTAEGLRATWVDRVLWRLFGMPPTLEQRIASAMQTETRLVQATRASIERQEFDLHISLSRIQALEDWNHGKVKKELSS